MSIGELHFIRPEWLILMPISLLLLIWMAGSTKTTNWAHYLPPQTLAVLKVGQAGRRNLLIWCLLAFWLLIITAAAGPSWTKQQVPLLQNQRALVILLDLSPSMLSGDVKPNRITRARYELLDALRMYKDGQYGLVAYAGSAHIVSPLTDDPDNISALVPALSPDVMPEQGSNTEAAVELAQRLLDDAGFAGGDLLLITDGVETQAATALTKTLKSQRSLSILGIGGSDLSPIPASGGGFVMNSNGDIVLTKLNEPQLRNLAHSTGGRFATLKADDSDITALIDRNTVAGDSNSAKAPGSHQNTKHDSWADMGFIFVLCALPLFLMLFRKGAVYIVLIGVIAPLSLDLDAAESRWQDLFQTQDQQGARLMSEGHYNEAANTFERTDWSAAAHYRDGQYDKAIAALQGREDILSTYNRANALAMGGKFQEAIDTYEQILEKHADHANAAHNKKVLEDLLRQQEQEKKQNDQNDPDSKKADQPQTENPGANEQQSENQKGESSQQEQTDPSREQSNQQDPSSNAPQQGDKPKPQQADNEDTKSLSAEHEEQSQQLDKQASSSESDSSKPRTQQAESEAKEPDSSQEFEPEQQEVSQDAPQVARDNETLSADSEQWLRGVEDDPAGLLRRKFEYQAWQGKQQRSNERRNKPSTADQQRY